MQDDLVCTLKLYALLYHKIFHNDDTLALQCGLHELDGVQSHQMLQRLHSLCILQGGGGGARGFQGGPQIFRTKKGGI